VSYIARLRGSVVELGRDHVIVDVGGVGYRAFCPGSTLAQVGSIGADVTLRTFLYIREDSQQLFGFLTAAEETTFQRLIGASGIGPATALSLLTQFTPEELAAIVDRRDAAALRSVKGIGAKSAEKLVLELQGKLPRTDGVLPAGRAAGAAYGDPAADVLVQLGLTPVEISAALARVPAPGAATDEERVRLALSASDRMGS
jgi:Holliday junction DNA helicase RuvA